MLHKHLLDFTRKYNKEFAIKGYSKLKKADLQQKIESVLNKQRKEIKEEYKKLKDMKAETKKPAPKKAEDKKLKEHSKHHTKKHMDIMKKEISKGKTFNQAHNIAIKKEPKKETKKPAPKKKEPKKEKPKKEAPKKAEPKKETKPAPQILEFNESNIKKLEDTDNIIYDVPFSTNFKDDKKMMLTILYKSGAEMTKLYNEVEKNIDTLDKKVEYKMFDYLFNIAKNNQKFAYKDTYAGNIIMMLAEGKPELIKQKDIKHGINNEHTIKGVYQLKPNKQKPGVIKIIILKDMTLRLDTYNIPNKNIKNLELKQESRSMISPGNIDNNYRELEIHIDTFENLKRKLKFVKSEGALKKYDKLLEQHKRYKEEYIGNKKLEPKAEELIKERDNEILEIIKLTKEKLEQNKLKPKKEKKEKKRTQKQLSKLLSTFTNKEIINFNEDLWFKTGEIKFDRFKNKKYKDT